MMFLLENLVKRKAHEKQLMLHSVLKMFVILDERHYGKIKKGRNPGVKKIV